MSLPTIELVYINNVDGDVQRISKGRWWLPAQATTPKWVIESLLANSKRFPLRFSAYHELQWVMKPQQDPSSPGEVCPLKAQLNLAMGWHEIQLFDMHKPYNFVPVRVPGLNPLVFPPTEWRKKAEHE